ncbi:8-amino-7-oxononanoate synthase [Malassezia caprae]|uniref:8-amino-7-oxononanoate synthase n=1 Tax=Malassezia caprae TaxID=1381934 RepID=A0AAF0E992_9BASI|nr:8-amino-7-oxononanoate synthase [Malassezia caprae]
MLEAQLQAALTRRERLGLRRTLQSQGHAGLVDVSSNDYLSLSRVPSIRQAVADALADVRIGSGGSRLLDGDSPLHARAEARLAAYFGAPAALLFNSGYDANVSLLTTLPQPGDIVVHDALVHASMHDGIRASRAAAVRAFRHNDAGDLERVLRGVLEELDATDEVQAGRRNVFLALESVYSMDGTVCSLRALAGVLEKFAPRGARHILVDEAHGVGVYGRGGRGVCEALQLAHVPSVRLITFGKAWGCAGAVVLCPPLWREYLLNYARPLIYSTALAPMQVAAVLCVLDALERGDVDEQIATLHTRTRQLYAALGRPYVCDPLPPAPIVPVYSAQPLELAARVQRAGFLVRAVRYPTVPRGEERVRLCVHAHNTREEMEQLAAVLAAPDASL